MTCIHYHDMRRLSIEGKTKRRLAIHEAGHVLAGLAGDSVVEHVSIDVAARNGITRARSRDFDFIVSGHGDRHRWARYAFRMIGGVAAEIAALRLHRLDAMQGAGFFSEYENSDWQTLKDMFEIVGQKRFDRPPTDKPLLHLERLRKIAVRFMRGHLAQLHGLALAIELCGQLDENDVDRLIRSEDIEPPDFHELCTRLVNDGRS
jgi:hypothetical protein